ncbi:MAG: DNA methyltransferase, partial [Spirochaetota bacterium]
MQNTLYTHDNLFILHGLNSNFVDLIYLDPPFNSKRMYSAPIGSKSAGASFKDIWTWSDIDAAYLDKLLNSYPALPDFITSIEYSHSKGMKAYITYMVQRLIEMKRILKDSGSIYLHCNPTAGHYLKTVMDMIFGKNNFRNEIIWCYTAPSAPKRDFPKKHDIILRYSKSNDYLFYPENIGIAYSKETIARTARGAGEYGLYLTSREAKEKHKNRLNDYGKVPEDYWIDIPRLQGNSRERTGYPTQKPLALLERIIKASSEEGDLVLDPFCGCATTCVAAQRLGRSWIGIDIEEKAAEVLLGRLQQTRDIRGDDFIRRSDIPRRTDIQEQPLTQNVKKKLFQDQRGRCNACDTPMKITDFETDYIIPKPKGGGDYYENYQLLCGNCKHIKGKQPMEYLLSKLRVREKSLKKVIFG